MYLVTLQVTQEEDLLETLMWNSDREEDAYIFMEAVVNLLNMDDFDGPTQWYVDLDDDRRLILSFSTLDQIDEVHSLKAEFADFL